MGRIISCKYEELEQLGQGGQAVVYKVRHVDYKTILALKVLPSYLLENEEMVARFEREALLMTRLHHRNIVRVLGSGHDEELNCHYIVMESIQGKTLKQYLRERGPLPLTEVLEIVRQVAGALDYAHKRTPAVIHRDVKPSNIMIEDLTGRAVVLDFGIAKELDDNERTRTGMRIGTWKYSSPEQLRHEPLTSSADVYSLGLVMYEMYTGEQFFSGMDEHAVLGKLLYDSKEHEPYFSRPTPSAFVSLVTKAIAKARNKRYSRMTDLLNDLEACWWVLDEAKTQVLVAPENVVVQPKPDHEHIEEIGEQIRKLEQERQLHMVTLVQRQVRDARAQAEKVSTQQWVSALFTEGVALEEKGAVYLRENRYLLAQEAYSAALNAFRQANEEAATVALQRQVVQLRQAVETAKVDAEHYGANERALTFYKRALALREQAEELWKQESYEQAQQIYEGAKSLFEDARDLAHHDAVKGEAHTARTQAYTLKEGAIEEGAKELTPSILQEAAATEQEADAALEREDFTQACALYQLASQRYEQAQRQTRLARRCQEVATGAEQVHVWQRRATELGVESTKPSYQQAVAAQQQAAAYLTDGDYTQAEGTYKFAQQLFEEVVRSSERERQQQAVAYARRDMEKLRTEAERAEAPQHLAAAWREALEVVETAEQYEQHEQLGEAAAEYRQAVQQFTQLQQTAIEHVQRVAAESARAQMETARSAAEQARAETWARTVWLQAIAIEQKATSIFQQEDFVQACTFFLTAQEHYSHAVQRAEAERSRRQRAAIAAAEEARNAHERAVAAAVPESYTIHRQAVVAQQQADERFSAQEYDIAIQTYRHARALYVEAVLVTERERQQQAVVQARQQMTVTREAAINVAAEQYVEMSWNEAQKIVVAAQQCEAQGEFSQAIVQYQQAAQRFIQAREVALDEMLRREAEGAQRQVQTVRETAVHAEAATLAKLVFAGAKTQEVEAAVAYERRDWAQARELYAKAQQQYSEARAQAQAEKQRQRQSAILTAQRLHAAQAQALAVGVNLDTHPLCEQARAIFQHAEELFANHDYVQSTQEYEQACRRYEEAAHMAERDSQRTAMAHAREQMETARAAAQQRGAEKRFSSTWNELEQEVKNGQQAELQEAFDKATALYVRVTERFVQLQYAVQEEQAREEVEAMRMELRAVQATPVALQQWAPTAWSEAQEREGQAERAYQDRDYSRAVTLYQNALQLFARAKQYAEQEQQAATRALRQQAEEARQQCTTARMAATQVSAQHRVPLLYSQALSCEAQGEESWQQERYAEAVQVYSEAQRVFVAAHALAEREKRKEEAETSRADMNQARETAVRQKVEVLAAVVFREAATVARQADLAFEQEDFVQAQKLYETAGQCYEQAQLDANVERQRRRAQAAAQHAHSFQRQAAAVGDLAKTHPLFKQAQDIQQQAATYFAMHEYEQAAHTYAQAQAFYEETFRLAKVLHEQQEAHSDQRDKAEQTKALAQAWQEKVGSVKGGQQQRAIKAFPEEERSFQQSKYKEAQAQYEKAASLWSGLLQQANPPEVMTQSSLAAAPEAMVVVPPSVPKKPQVLRINIRYALLGTALLLLIIAVYEVYWLLSLPKGRVDQTPQSQSFPNGRTKPVLLPLTITSTTPEPTSQFVIKEGARQKFSIQATSTAKGVLRYVWYLNGKEQVNSVRLDFCGATRKSLFLDKFRDTQTVPTLMLHGQCLDSCFCCNCMGIRADGLL